MERIILICSVGKVTLIARGELLFCVAQKGFYADFVEPFTRGHRSQPDVRIFLHGSSIPIFRGMQVTNSLITLSQTLSEISGIQRLVAICHEKINLDRIRCLSTCDQFSCLAL